MGSIDKACIAGFLCRLCSEMHRTVIHIYGDQGQKHGLLEKINGYLPVTITPTDPLPKTICERCLRRVEEHYELLIRIKKCRKLRELTRQACERAATCEISDVSDISDVTDDEVEVVENN